MRSDGAARFLHRAGIRRIVRRLSQALLAPRRVTCGVQLGERRLSFWLVSYLYRPLAVFGFVADAITRRPLGTLMTSPNRRSHTQSPQAKQKRQGGGIVVRCQAVTSSDGETRGLHRCAVSQPRSAKRGAPAPGLPPDLTSHRPQR